MGRSTKAVVVKPGQVITYVMELDGNRARYLSGEEKEPFEIDLIPMSSGDVSKMERNLGKFTRGDRNVVQIAQNSRDNMLGDRIKAVRNYNFQATDNGDILRPTTGQELVAMIARAPGTERDDVCDEMEQAVKDHSYLTRGLRDLLKPPHDSS